MLKQMFLVCTIKLVTFLNGGNNEEIPGHYIIYFFYIFICIG